MASNTSEMQRLVNGSHVDDSGREKTDDASETSKRCLLELICVASLAQHCTKQSSLSSSSPNLPSHAWPALCRRCPSLPTLPCLCFSCDRQRNESDHGGPRVLDVV